MGASDGGSGIMWKATVLVLLGVVVFQFMKGYHVKELEVPSFIRLQFDRDSSAQIVSADTLEALDRDELLQRQEALEAQLRQLQQERQAEAPPPEPDPMDRAMPAVPSLTGTWYAWNGAQYQLQQTGREVTFQELSAVGPTAVGSGMFAHGVLDLQYRTLFNTTGSGRLQLSADGQQLSGQITDHVSGFTQPLVINR